MRKGSYIFISVSDRILLVSHKIIYGIDSVLSQMGSTICHIRSEPETLF